MENEEYVFQVMIEHMLTVRASVLEACAKLHKLVLNFVAGDEVCRRFMTVPGVGPITALSFKAAIDDPQRFRRSRNVEIGRASCRDRVCQYGEIMVGADPLKKKKK